MKQHLSVLMLAIRSSFYKLLALLAVMAVSEGILFHFALENNQVLEYAFDDAYTRFLFLAGFAALCILLTLPGSERSGNKERYTLRRLGVSERAVVLWTWLGNACCILIFWAAQLAIVLLLCKYYTMSVGPGAFNSQTVFLAFYRSSFLHSLLPLAELTRWMRNIALVVCLGGSTAAAPCRMRRGETPFDTIVLMIASIVLFVRPVGSIWSDILLTGYAVCATAYAVWMCRKEATDDDSN